MILVSFRFLSFLPSALYLYSFLPLPFLLPEIWLWFLNSHKKQRNHTRKKITRSRGSLRIKILANVLTCKLIFAKAYWVINVLANGPIYWLAQILKRILTHWLTCALTQFWHIDCRHLPWYGFWLAIDICIWTQCFTVVQKNKSLQIIIIYYIKYMHNPYRKSSETKKTASQCVRHRGWPLQQEMNMEFTSALTAELIVIASKPSEETNPCLAFKRRLQLRSLKSTHTVSHYSNLQIASN